jgi:gamma-glutamylcyclotransferase (GGCT)/AIG2-like uncharacterized protein YtfP
MNFYLVFGLLIFICASSILVYSCCCCYTCSFKNVDTKNQTRTCLFVYGTLKKQERNHRFIASSPSSVFIKHYRLFGYQLVLIDHSYPGLVHSLNPTDYVDGEIWAVDQETLHWIDVLEGIGVSETNDAVYKRITLSDDFDISSITPEKKDIHTTTISTTLLQTYEYTGPLPNGPLLSVFSNPKPRTVLHQPV